MEQAIAVHSVVIAHSHAIFGMHYFESIVAFLQSHFCRVKIFLINMYTLGYIQIQSHTFHSTCLQKNVLFHIKCDVKQSIHMKQSEAIAVEIVSLIVK